MLFTLMYENNKKRLIDYKSFLINYFQNDFIDICIEEQNLDSLNNIIYISYLKQNINEKEFENIAKHLSNVIYKIIVLDFYCKELDLFIEENYFFIGEEELKNIRGNIISTLMEDGFQDEEMYFNDKINIIKEDILDFLIENKGINIDGYIMFRMKEMKNHIYNTIDKVIENFMIEKEYEEFIKLLQYFVDIQESKINEVNIIIKKDGKYIINDGEGRDIFNVIVEKIDDELDDEDVSIDDRLISGLVTNSPKKIVIHGEKNSKNTELLNTIQKVFKGRVVKCNECSMCKSKINKIF